jgi:electron transfer flavoprotein alpha subunit
MHANNVQLNNLDSQAYCKAIIAAANMASADCVVFSNNNTAKAVAPRVAAGLQAGLVSGAVALPNTSNGFLVKKSVFSGKAFCDVQINTSKKVICITPNSFPVTEKVTTASIENFEPNIGSNRITVTAVNQSTGRVPLPEAELVVSGGRGLKGPEHWGILEDLAKSLGAEMACSRPVADSHWRPHHEHVGQTGGTIRPNLYIAVGISGAIQHLAGVNGSKTIVVINKDSEAPFFKAADYGVCADAFEVLPKLTEAVNKYKASLA